MKRDTTRKKLYDAKLHKKKKLLHVHLSKELRNKLNLKSRSMLINKGDTVKIMRGSHKDKQAKVAKVSYTKTRVFLEGITRKNARGTEILIPFHPSNLMLLDINMTPERKKKFGSVIEKNSNEITR